MLKLAVIYSWDPIQDFVLEFRYNYTSEEYPISGASYQQSE